jgi:DNA-binding transcriptional LysR family regulator
VFGEKEFNLVVSPIHPLFRRHKGPFNAGLTDGALSAQVFGEKEFNLVVSPIHPLFRRHKGPFNAAADPHGGSLGKGEGAAGKAAFSQLPPAEPLQRTHFQGGVESFAGEAVFTPHLARFRPKLLAKPCQTYPKWSNC